MPNDNPPQSKATARPLDPQEKEDVKVGRAIQAMMRTEGWTHYERLLKYHVEQKKRDVLLPFDLKQDGKAKEGVLFGAWDALLAGEAHKGAIMGLTLALGLPASIIANMESILSRYESSEESDE